MKNSFFFSVSLTVESNRNSKHTSHWTCTGPRRFPKDAKGPGEPCSGVWAHHGKEREEGRGQLNWSQVRPKLGSEPFGGVIVSGVSPAASLPHPHGSINRNLFSNSSRNQMSKITVSTRWVPSGGSKGQSVPHFPVASGVTSSP